MKFSSARSSFAEALSIVVRAVAARSSFQALEGVHITAKDGELILCGYNLEIGIVSRCEAEVASEGSAVVSAKFLSDIIRKLPGDRISFSTDVNGNSSISSGIAKFELAAMTEEDYPDLPATDDEESFTVPSDIIKLMIAGTVFSASLSEIKPVQTGVLFDFKGDTVRAAATDNSRLAVRTEKVSGMNADSRFVINANTLREIDRIMRPGESVKVCVSKKHASLEFADIRVVARLLEGEFYKFENALLATQPYSLTVDTDVFSDCVDRVSLLVDEKIRRCIRFTFGSGMISMVFNSPVGKAYDECACEGEAPDTEMGLNNRFLLDVLKAVGDSRIKLCFASGRSPIVIRPVEGEAYFYMIAPVHIT